MFGLAFVVFAVRHMGWRKTAIYAAVAIGVGVLAENGAVRYGLPYGYYRFNPSLRGDEIFVGDVPLMVSLSYTFMSYFAFAAARLLVGGPYRTRSSWPAMEYAMAVMLAVWALWVIDPISRLGRHFFLGELFRYEGPGFWFGLPLRSQVGFALTSVVLVGVLTWMMRDEKEEPVERLLDHPRLSALLTYVGQVLFMTVTAFWVGRQGVAQGDALAGATFIIATPMVLMTAVYWRSLRPVARGAADSETEDEGSAVAR
jgi:uncharacterized membrane protein